MVPRDLYSSLRASLLTVLRVLYAVHSRPQRLRSFWSAPRIATSGQVQRHSGFEWLCKLNRLRPEPIRFVRLDSEHAQNYGKSVNRGLPILDPALTSRFLVLTKRSAASGDENVCHCSAKFRQDRGFDPPCGSHQLPVFLK